MRDVILKKWNESGPEATVYTFDESKYEGLEEQRLVLEANIKERQEEITELEKEKKIWKDSSVAELNKRYAVVAFPNQQPRLVEREQVKAQLEALDKAGKAYKLIPIDDEDRIERVVRSVATQEVPEPFEVIVVVSGTDRTAEIVLERFPEVAVVELDRPALPGQAVGAGEETDQPRPGGRREEVGHRSEHSRRDRAAPSAAHAHPRTLASFGR